MPPTKMRGAPANPEPIVLVRTLAPFCYAHVQRHGIEIISGINDVNPSLRTVFIKGPDGAIIELLQRLPHP